jgi:hypothetical protein
MQVDWLLLLLFLAPTSTSALWPKSASGTKSASHQDKILLRDVTALTFKKDAFTIGRRSKGVPQIECVDGDACGKVDIPVIQCRNVGWDGDVQWQCQSELSDDYRFGYTQVTCGV